MFWLELTSDIAHYSPMRYFLTLCFLLTMTLSAQVPEMMNFQGRVIVDNVNYSGTGHFKFVLYSESKGIQWVNDGSNNGSGEPVNAVQIPVAGGLYSMLLGNQAIANMTPIPVDTFDYSDITLRVWFSSDGSSFEQLSPDQRLASVAYAMRAASVDANSIGASEIRANAIGASELAPNTVSSSNIANGGIQSEDLAPSAISAIAAASGLQAGSFEIPNDQRGFNDSLIQVSFPSGYATPPIVTLSPVDVLGNAEVRDFNIQLDSISAGGFTARISGFRPQSGDLIDGRIGDYPGIFSQARPLVVPNGAFFDIAWWELNGVPGAANFDRFTVLRTGFDSNGLLVGTAANFVPTVALQETLGAPSAETYEFLQHFLANIGGDPALVFVGPSSSQAERIFLMKSTGVGSLGNILSEYDWPSAPTLVFEKDPSEGRIRSDYSLAIVNGNPAIAFRQTSTGHKFIRANDSSGSSWGSAVVVETSSNTGIMSNLVVVDGKPAFALTGDFLAQPELRFVRALDANGDTWSAPIQIGESGFTFFPGQIAMQIVEGHPAIMYLTSDGVNYVRANDSAGTDWPMPMLIADVDAQRSDNMLSFEIVQGVPAVAWIDNLDKKPRFMKAADSTGSEWGPSDEVTSADEAFPASDFTSVKIVPSATNVNLLVTGINEFGNVEAYQYTPEVPPLSINWISVGELR